MFYGCDFDSVPKPKDGGSAEEIEPIVCFQVCRIIRYESARAFENWMDARRKEDGIRLGHFDVNSALFRLNLRCVDSRAFARRMRRNAMRKGLAYVHRREA